MNEAGKELAGSVEVAAPPNIRAMQDNLKGFGDPLEIWPVCRSTLWQVQLHINQEMRTLHSPQRGAYIQSYAQYHFITGIIKPCDVRKRHVKMDAASLCLVWGPHDGAQLGVNVSKIEALTRVIGFILKGSQIAPHQLQGQFKSKTSIQECGNEIQNFY